jgi:transcriptional antiterminator RfaH
VAALQEQLVWLVVRTKPKQERHALEALAGRGIEAYCPRILEPPQHRHAPRGPVPLFPGYVFARCLLPQCYRAVHYCSGVAGVVRFGQELAVLDDAIVEALREREGERGYVVVREVRRQPRQGEAVRIVEGPLAGLSGVVERYVPGRDRVRLLLRVVRGVRCAEVPATQVESAQ